MLNWEDSVAAVADIVMGMEEKDRLNFLDYGESVSVPDGYTIVYLPDCSCKTCATIRNDLRALGVVVNEPYFGNDDYYDYDDEGYEDDDYDYDDEG